MAHCSTYLRGITAAILAGVLTTGSANAQPMPPEVFKRDEQSFGIATWNAACEIGKGVIGNLVGQIWADTAVTVARTINLCPQPGSEPKPVSTAPTTSGGSPAPTGAPVISVAARPGFEMQIIKVDLRNKQVPKVAIAGPEARYAPGDGFVVMLTANSPGFIQVWSVDDDSSALVEEVTLNGAAQSISLLPANYEEGGFYEFKTSGGTDILEIRYLPCKHSLTESFEASVNKAFAENLKPFIDNKVVAMNAALPVCAPTQEARKQQLRQATTVQPSFNPDRNRYLAISTGSGAIVAHFAMPRAE